MHMPPPALYARGTNKPLALLIGKPIKLGEGAIDLADGDTHAAQSLQRIAAGVADWFNGVVRRCLPRVSGRAG